MQHGKHWPIQVGFIGNKEQDEMPHSDWMPRMFIMKIFPK